MHRIPCHNQRERNFVLITITLSFVFLCNLGHILNRAVHKYCHTCHCFIMYEFTFNLLNYFLQGLAALDLGIAL